MPLNIKKAYKFTPTPVGEVRLHSRNSRRSRLVAGGSYYRSREYGEAANLISVLLVEDSTATPLQGFFIVQHAAIKPDEQLSATGMPLPTVEMFSSNLAWNEELRVFKDPQGLLQCEIRGIRWQIAGAVPTRQIGVVRPGAVVSAEGTVFKQPVLTSQWPAGAELFIRARTNRYSLVATSSTDATTSLSTTGWDPSALRAAVDSDPWIKMPGRGSATAGSGGLTGANEDITDTGADDVFLTAFPLTALAGGDGLPAAPVGDNTGPDRSLVHLNYAEKEDGSLGELNQVFEWVGDSAVVGSWQRYS